MKIPAWQYFLVLGIWFVFSFILIFVNSFFKLPVFSTILSQSIGYVVFSLGITLFIYCTVLFLQDPISLMPLALSGDEVQKNMFSIRTKGISAYTRNPIPLTIQVVLLGIALVFGHLLGFIYFFLSFTGFQYIIVCIVEPHYKEYFGDEWSRYSKHAPRWFWGIPF